MSKIHVGYHISCTDLEDNLKTLVAAGCDSFQIFSRNNRQLNAKSLLWSNKNIKPYIEQHNLTGITHGTYVMNFAKMESPQQKVIEDELKLCDFLGLKGIVVHYGSFEGSIDPVINATNKIMKFIEDNNIKAKLLIENTAGGGRNRGAHYDELIDLYESVDNNKNMSFVIDTAHSFAYGYKLENDILDRLHDAVPITAIHFNDSGSSRMSCVDRHARIGTGHISKIGIETTIKFAKKNKIPLILETPPVEQAQETPLNDVYTGHNSEITYIKSV
jgi:deoxyribonuclease-4